jgi:hypothetical protein
MYLAKMVLLAGVLVGIPWRASAQDHKVESLFVYNFAKYIEWPTERKSGDFVIGVVGDEATVLEFRNTLEGKLKDAQKIVIKDANAGAYNSCHLVFVAPSKSAQLPRVRKDTTDPAVVIVTEKSGSLSEGSTINMVKENGKLQYEITDRLKDYSVKISSQLLRLAKS